MYGMDPRFLAALGMTLTVNTAKWGGDSVNELVNTYNSGFRRNLGSANDAEAYPVVNLRPLTSGSASKNGLS